jgi:hypothetical protein
VNVVVKNEARQSSRRFYEAALDEAEREELPAAREVEGLDEEVALLRVRLRRAIKERPEDLALMLRGLETLRRLLVSRYRLPKEDAAAAEAELVATREMLKKLVEERDGRNN